MRVSRYVNNAATPTGHDHLFKYGDGVAQGSRWGLRGTEDLGGGLKALFVLESGFSSGDGTLQQGGALFGRQAFVGLAKNDVGSLTFGRQYSFSTDYLGGNYSMGSQTPAGNYAYHINDLDQLTSSRINNSIKFSSANFAGVTFGGMYGFSNQAGAFAGSPTTTAAGTTTQGSSSAYSFGLNYAGGPFGIGAAYTEHPLPERRDAGVQREHREREHGRLARPRNVSASAHAMRSAAGVIWAQLDAHEVRADHRRARRR